MGKKDDANEGQKWWVSQWDDGSLKLSNVLNGREFNLGGFADVDDVVLTGREDVIMLVRTGCGRRVRRLVRVEVKERVRGPEVETERWTQDSLLC